jgi:ornithine cyclodeaminase
MKLITEAQVAQVLGPEQVHTALRQAFEQFARGEAAVLGRSRAALAQASGSPMVSAMGAVLPPLLGTKVYSTLSGQFQFLVNLFDAGSGAPLATLQANELTRLRTAATTALAVDALAAPEVEALAVFGAGVQAQAHVEALLPLRPFKRLLLVARSRSGALATQLAPLAQRQGAAVEVVDATRASEPLFDGHAVRPGTLVAAVGSSKPVARELDDALLIRASAVVVEWKTAALAEAGELVRAAPGLREALPLRELGELLLQGWRPAPEDIVVYKSVGIGLEDIALAGLVWQRLQEQPA